MAHSPKKSKSNAEKIDKLFQGMDMMMKQLQAMQQQINNSQAQQMITTSDEVDLKKEYVPQPEIIWPEKETPYKVMQVASHAPNFTIADIWPTKKIFMGNGRTFRNRKEAMEYVERMRRDSPGIQLEVFPV